jgi:protein-disulfide isomerase
VHGFRPPDRLQHTRRALAVAELARDELRLEAFRSAAFERAVLAADDAAYLARVDERQAVARAQGIRGIPTFVFGSERVVGCQPYDVLLGAARRAGVAAR